MYSDHASSFESGKTDINSLNDKGAGFRVDTNKITIIDKEGETPYPLKNKSEVAGDIINRLVETLKK